MATARMGNLGSRGKGQVGHAPSAWCQKYGQRHRPQRIREFPEGIPPPSRVRLYRRDSHFLVQWWDKAEKKTLTERVDGDLLSALARARTIDERLAHFRTAGTHHQPITHQELVDGYVADLQRRADAGQLDPRSVTRYSSALSHYLAYALRPDIERQFRHVAAVNREFALGLSAYLNTATVASKGRPGGKPHPMQGQDYVVNVVRGMFEWAADADRGGLMPEGFRNPFGAGNPRRTGLQIDLLGEPDITVAMAAEFLSVCDLYQLRLFTPMVFYGLRAAEPAFLFCEDVDGGWLRVVCRPELDYQTKGRRDKRLPLIACVADLIGQPSSGQAAGLLYHRRPVDEGRETPSLVNASLAAIVDDFERRCAAAKDRSATARRKIRDRVFRDAGGITYDNILAEFRKVTTGLAWPANATLKDFRHLFATNLENAGMPEFYRRYLMGQSVGRTAIVNYTHLNEICQRFQEAVERQFQPLVDAVVRRTSELR